MAKLLGPDFISLEVRNLPTSRNFYTEILGFAVDPRFDTSDVVVFDTNSIPFALKETKGSQDQAPQPGQGVALWIDCDNVNELHARLDAAKVTIITPPYDAPSGRTFVFADPDGYWITVNEHPWDRFPLGGKKQS